MILCPNQDGQIVRCLEPMDIEDMKLFFCLLAVKWVHLYHSLKLSSFTVTSAEMTAGIYVPFMATPAQEAPAAHLIIPAPFKNGKIDFARMAMTSNLIVGMLDELGVDAWFSRCDH